MINNKSVMTSHDNRNITPKDSWDGELNRYYPPLSSGSSRVLEPNGLFSNRYMHLIVCCWVSAAFGCVHVTRLLLFRLLLGWSVLLSFESFFLFHNSSDELGTCSENQGVHLGEPPQQIRRFKMSKSAWEEKYFPSSFEKKHIHSSQPVITELFNYQ